MRFFPILVLVAGVGIAVGLSSFFIVTERQQAIVLEFGKVKHVHTDAGLYFKFPPPFNTVLFYDKRILPLETGDLQITTLEVGGGDDELDARRLVVNAFARWRIADPQRFREAVQSQEQGAQRLQSIMREKVRQVLGTVPSGVILSDARAPLMVQIRDLSREEAAALGVDVVDVRIRRVDLPPANLAETYASMSADRQKVAADVRARGREAKQARVAEAEREAIELVSAAERDAQVIRGEADAERTRILAAAFSQDPEFFAFYRSLSAYERALGGENSSMVLTPDSQFFEYLKYDDGSDGLGGQRP